MREVPPVVLTSLVHTLLVCPLPPQRSHSDSEDCDWSASCASVVSCCRAECELASWSDEVRRCLLASEDALSADDGDEGEDEEEPGDVEEAEEEEAEDLVPSESSSPSDLSRLRLVLAVTTSRSASSSSASSVSGIMS